MKVLEDNRSKVVKYPKQKVFKCKGCGSKIEVDFEDCYLGYGILRAPFSYKDWNVGKFFYWDCPLCGKQNEYCEWDVDDKKAYEVGVEEQKKLAKLLELWDKERELEREEKEKREMFERKREDEIRWKGLSVKWL